MGVVWEEDFEDGTLGDFTALDSDWGIESSPARGSYSAGINANADKDTASVYPDILDGGVQINSLEYWYYEDSGGSGGGLCVYDSSGNEVIGFASSNPDWCIKDGNGWEETSNGDYRTWTKVEIVFDWDNGEATIYATLDGGSTVTHSSRPLINNTDVESIFIKGFANTGGGWESASQEMWFDDFAVYATGYEVSGTVKEEGSNVSRTVRLYKRSTGELVDEVTSEADGSFVLEVGNNDEHYVIALDDTSDATDYNALIFDRVVPVEESS